MSRRIVFALVALLAAGLAHANWTATGTFLYQDRDWDSSGFTGTIGTKPIRFADVEITDPNKSGSKALLAKGRTEADGSFAIAVTDSSTRTIRLRVYTRSNNTSDLWVKVTNQSGSVYAGAVPDISGHTPNTNVNYGTMTAQAFAGAETFNIYDLGVYGADYVKALTGSRPNSAKTVTFKWQSNAGVTDSYTSGGTVSLRDSAGYDDTVILHEWSHYVMYYYSKSSNPGGGHALSDCVQDVRLAFDEGRASFFGNAVARYFGFPNPATYLRTSGAPGVGGATNTFDLEDQAQYPCPGDQSEVSVARSLWDPGDGPATADSTPGLDEAFDTLTLPDTEVWQVFTGPVKNATTVTEESFWDGWFDATIANGFKPEMTSIFGALSIGFVPDGQEPNESSSQARPIVPNGQPFQLTLFADPDGDGKGQADTDVFSFAAVSGTVYTLQTQNLFNGANTKLEVLDSNGSTVLASNDDRATGDRSSLVTWTAPRSATFYVRVTDSSGINNYGSYDLAVTNP